jgi:hypothetical protein
MPTFELQFPAAEIAALASRFGDADDARLLGAAAAARARGHYTREEFIAVCAWKTARSRSKVASNPERAVVEATRRALATPDEETRMDALLELQGVGVPTASTLLYFAFPDDYPILDVRALESLGVKPRSQYPVRFWLAYLCACRDLARRSRVSIRTLDKARCGSTPRSMPHTPHATPHELRLPAVELGRRSGSSPGTALRARASRESPPGARWAPLQRRARRPSGPGRGA